MQPSTAPFLIRGRTARSNLDPTSQLYDEGFDSVAASASWGGLRVPEFVIYRREQCVPRYILAVRQVTPSRPQGVSLASVGGMRLCA